MNHFYLITATKDSSGAISMASYDPKNTDRTADMAQLLRLAAHMFDDTHPSVYDHNIDVTKHHIPNPPVHPAVQRDNVSCAIYCIYDAAGIA